MNDINKWKYDFNDLNPDDQLKIAKSIMGELQDNESFLEADEYDKQKSKIVINFFKELINSTTNKNKLKEYTDLLNRFKSLSDKNKDNAISEILNIIKKYILIQEQSDKETICLSEGHKFGKWEHNEWTTYETTCIDHEIIPNYPVKHEVWVKTCTRCGYKSKTHEEPKSITYAKNRKDKQNRIKELEQELKMLKHQK